MNTGTGSPHKIVTQYGVPLVSASVSLGVCVVTHLIARGAQVHQISSAEAQPRIHPGKDRNDKTFARMQNLCLLSF